MKRYLLVLLISFITIHTSAQAPHGVPARRKIDLSGSWQFALDTLLNGIAERWYARTLEDSIDLPGTTDLSKKGFYNKDSTTMHLSRVYRYEGPAWYRKKLTIPEDFKGKYISLFLERTKVSKIWIDDQLVGGSSILQSPQEFDLSRYLAPGEHVLTILVNNNLKLTPYGNVHIYSDDAQTNWNGILGEMYLQATSRTHLNDLQIYPDIAKKKIDVQLGISNADQLKDLNIELVLARTVNGKTEQLKTQRFKKASAGRLNLAYNLGDDMRLWDEYDRPIYKITAVITGNKTRDALSADFGMRKFATKGTQFSINGRTAFLRGKHDAAVFPLTGHTPMDVPGWLSVFNIAKAYGINHYRFHSWSPPEAAFTAADQLGIYLQVELLFWGGLDTDSLALALRAEGMGMLKHFANHASFVMFSHGNEIWGGHDRVEQNILAFKAFDPRPLYTMGSNVNIGYHPLQKSSDFFVGSRIGSKGDTRLTHAFADAKNGGRLNSLPPATDFDYSYQVSQMQVPIVSHEIGQYQIYPDYHEISKYTGVVEARNLEVFRNRLKAAGMLDQNADFQQASGKWAALCYKAEMEAALRTKGFGGFQLLDLQDFPGQGTALVGILDAFMDSKNVISKADWLMSINDVVVLATFPKYVWTSAESLQAKIEVANYAKAELANNISWTLKNKAGAVLASNSIKGLVIKQGGLSDVGVVNVPLSGITSPEEIFLELSMENTTYKNIYPFWVYPPATSIAAGKDIEVLTKLDDRSLKALQKGGKILLFPQTNDIKDKSVPELFPPEFWNWGMFKGISENVKKPVSPGTLGLLTKPEHPLFNSFPTDAHTNWQWFSIIKVSNPLILDETDPAFRPIVQVIDNLERNHKMGMVFEFKVGKGKLLVCMSQLNLIIDKPEAQQLYKSMLLYMKSDAFQPKYPADAEVLRALGLR